MPTQKHLSVVHQPFGDLILAGKKTIETRFTKVKCAPFKKVKKGDIVLLKQQSGPIIGEFTVKDVIYFENTTPLDIMALKKYAPEICADVDPNFWEKRTEAKYVSFIYVSNPTRYPTPKPFSKKDRRGWVVLG